MRRQEGGPLGCPYKSTVYSNRFTPCPPVDRTSSGSSFPIGWHRFGRSHGKSCRQHEVSLRCFQFQLDYPTRSVYQRSRRAPAVKHPRDGGDFLIIDTWWTIGGDKLTHHRIGTGLGPRNARGMSKLGRPLLSGQCESPWYFARHTVYPLGSSSGSSGSSRNSTDLELSFVITVI